MACGSAKVSRSFAGVATLLLIAPALSAQEVPHAFPAVERIVAIGDVHGAYDTFVQTLKAAGLVSEDLAWTGGATHLVQTGDVVARGPSSRKAVDLLMALEPQAEAAGGKVHPLIGNHEFWFAVGHLQFVSDAELEAFSGARDDELRGQAGQAGIDARPGELALREAWGPDGVYGKWVRGRNAAIQIGDHVFVHGGVTAQGAELGLAGLNARVREEMDVESWETGFAASEDGPLFSRLYSADDLIPDDIWEIERELGFVLESLGARAMVMGHTVTYGLIEPRFGGRALLIDAGMLDLYMGGRSAALVIEGEKRSAVYGAGTATILIPIPDAIEGEAGERYVDAVAAVSDDAALAHWEAVVDCSLGRFDEGADLHEASGVFDRELTAPFAWRREAAECYESSGDAERANELYALYLEGLLARAESTGAWDHWDRYARECLRLGRGIDQAFDVAAELASAQPQSGEAKLTLAWAYIEKGDARRALRVLRAAERLGAAGSFEMLVLTGRAQAEQGDLEAALESYRQAEALRPGDPDVQEAMAKLGSGSR